MKHALTIPSHQSPEFAALPKSVREEVTLWLHELGRVFCAKNKTKAMDAAAKAMGVSYESVRGKYYALRAAGSWKALVNGSKARKGTESVPIAILEEFRVRCEKNQRKSEPAWRWMIRDWKANGSQVKNPGASMSDLPWPASINGGRWPDGCSYGNLMRLCRERFREFDLVALRDGMGKALAIHGHKVRTTRVGLWVGSHYLFDDVLRDVKMLLIAKNQIVRIQELGAFDLYSGDRFAVHRRPQFTLADGRKDSLKEYEMRFLLANVLRNIGYSPRGTEIPAELGTATIRPELREFILRHSNEKITVRLSGITGKEQAIAGYWGRGGGNPRTKAALESHHNLIHNEAGHLPAATGHDRKPPEWLAGVEAVTLGVCKALATLPQNRAGLLMAPMLEYWQGLGLLAEIDQIIALRTDHDLEGWARCGHTCVEYRRDPRSEDWLSQRDLLALPGFERDLLVAASESNKDYRRARNLSPREVLSAGMGELIRFPDHVIALMFCDEQLGEDLRVTKQLNEEGKFSVENKFADPEPMEFKGELMTPTGDGLRLSEGVNYGVVLNPWDAQALWVYDPRGGFLGTAARINRVSPIDERAVEKALGEWQHQKSLLLKPLGERHVNAAIEIAQIQANNALVTGGAPVSAGEISEARQSAKRIKAQTGDLADLIPTSVTLDPVSPETREEKQAGNGFNVSDLY